MQENVTKQSNGYDCGLHSLANSYAVLNGMDPTQINWASSEKLRDQFNVDMRNKSTNGFPFTSIQRYKRILDERELILNK